MMANSGNCYLAVTGDWRALVAFHYGSKWDIPCERFMGKEHSCQEGEAIEMAETTGYEGSRESALYDGE